MDLKKHTMVCVTQQKTCERLIKKGQEIKRKLGGDLLVVHVAPEGYNILGNTHEDEALEYLFDISKSVEAEMTVLRSTNVEKTITDFCYKNNVARIIMGESLEASPESNMIVRLEKKLGDDVKILVIPTE
ncbi:adenine nucleotide alpha hydrolase family protein [Alkaliphilus crotonatoxidans]